MDVNKFANKLRKEAIILLRAADVLDDQTSLVRIISSDKTAEPDLKKEFQKPSEAASSPRTNV